MSTVVGAWNGVYFEPTDVALDRAAGGRLLVLTGAGVLLGLAVIAKLAWRRSREALLVGMPGASTLAATLLLGGTLLPLLAAVLGVLLVAAGGSLMLARKDRADAAGGVDR